MLLKSSCFEIFGDGKYCLLSSQNVDGNMIFTDYWNVLVLNFSEMRNTVFLSQKVDGKIIFTDYWNVLVLNFSEMGNTVFFWAKKLMKRWYLLITERFLFWTFWWWGIRSFIQPKSWWKDDIYLVFLNFPWYYTTWEIRLFVQCFPSLHCKKWDFRQKAMDIFI